MPHGQLTPLGRQLKTVLANLSRPARRIHSYSPNARRDFHDSRSRRQSSFPEPDLLQYEALLPESPTTEKQHARQHKTLPERSRPKEQLARPFARNKYAKLEARLKGDELLQTLTHPQLNAPQYRKAWADLLWRSQNLDLAHIRPKGWTKLGTAGITLESIVARYIRQFKAGSDDGQAGRESSFELHPLELDFLRQRGLNQWDVIDWADILLASDSNDAAKKLFHRLKSDEKDPLFVILHTLRREYISAEALRTIILHISHLLREKISSRERRRQLPILLVAITRLIRHAREVWPQSFSAIVSLFLASARRIDALPAIDTEDYTQHLTYALNKIMSLLSLSTAVRPFKDNVFQEMAIISILRYMDDHNPPLQITRPGYRAVIRVQLAQRKTADEQQWAQLKALSWPPWKVDRTGMDASVGLEYGITRARATLITMRAAGYAPHAWERAAETYTGWDPDGTPTIQRRVVAVTGYEGSILTHKSDPLDTSSSPYTPFTPDTAPNSVRRVSTRSSPSPTDPGNKINWPARINSTRTIQEAWACYLAWEDAKLPSDQRVYLAIMQKLYEQDTYPPEETTPENQLKELQQDARPAWDLLPGDTPRLSPLPPSTHLYTYTRTPPPTLDEFYTTLRIRGVEFKSHTLAYLLRNASSFQTGLRRIQDHLPQHPALQAFLNLDSTQDLSLLPPEIFTAAIQFLARSGGYFLDDEAFRDKWTRKRKNIRKKGRVHEEREHHLFFSNTNSIIVRAIILLRRHPACGRNTWVAVFEGLTRESHLAGLGQGFDRDEGGHRVADPPIEYEFLGAQVAYGITRKLGEMYRRQFGDMDSEGFLRVCWGVEKMVWGVWRVGNFNASSFMSMVEARVRSRTEEWDYYTRYIRNFSAARHLREEFAALVGAREVAEEVYGDVKLPRLLHIPGPALLHAYVRALGWAGDFDGILELVRFMTVFWEELEERMERDRGGRDMMRRVLVGVRGFLERSWRGGRASISPTGPRGSGERRAEGYEGEESVDDFLGRAADEALVKEIREIVDGMGEVWEGWASDEEVEGYLRSWRFEGVE